MENPINPSETLIFKDANDIDAPKPDMLFSNFWHRGELAVLFGNQQSGKSLLAVQVAEAISSGKSVEGFQLDISPGKVLYFDFDKSGYHFSRLYSGYPFSPNFKRLVINKKNLDFKHLAEQFFFSVEETMCEEGAEVLIFDSLPAIKYLIKDSYFLKGIQHLKETYGVSILLVGETRREIKGKPLRLNCLDVHKHLTGFADSVFAMGHTSGEADERYLVHLKACENRTYNKDNVVVGRLVMSSAVTGVTPVTQFLPGFCFSGYNTESYVIAPPPEGLELEILVLKQQQPELSLGDIAKQLKTNKMKVKRVLEKYPVKFKTQNPKFETVPSPQFLSMAAPREMESIDATSFSNPRLQPGGMKNPATPATDSCLRGNDGLPHTGTRGVTLSGAEECAGDNVATLPFTPFRGDVELSGTSKANKTASSFSNPRLQPGGMENLSTPSTDSRLRVNDGLPHTGAPGVTLSGAEECAGDNVATLPFNPFRGDVELSGTSKANKTASSFSNPRLQPGGMENPATLHTDSRLCGNDGLPHTLTTTGTPGVTLGQAEECAGDNVAIPFSNPFRGDVELSGASKANKTASSFSNPRLQPGGMESPATLHTDSRLRGNDGLPHTGAPGVTLSGAEECAGDNVATLPFNPFRGDVELSGASKANKTVSSFSNPRLQPGGMENPATLHTDSRLRGNDGLPHTEMPASLPSNPFRGDVKLSGHSSKPGAVNNQPTFSQRVKMQIAKANTRKIKTR